MRHVLLALVMIVIAALAPHRASAAETLSADPCARLDALYPEPGRQGLPGENAFRPLPELSPVRAQPGGPGTVSMAIDVDHLSQLPAGKPGYVYVGNYPVTEMPSFRIVRGAATTMQVVQPETGRAVAMPEGCVQQPSWGFAGTEWALVQGDTLDVLLHSHLDYDSPTQIQIPTNGAVPCRASNLHTHGLLVSPYHPVRAGLGPYGDYVMDVTQPHGSIDYGTGTDDCGTNLGDMARHGHGLTDLPLHYVTKIPGQPGVNSLATGEHPSGLFWYHPHPHGFSQPQVAGGTTGAITIGALTDYACPNGEGSPGNCTLANDNVRLIELKDTEIQSYGGGGGLWSQMLHSDSGLCNNTGGRREGECQASEQGNPGKWVFTLNGVQYPTIHPGAGRTEIWRIVNASPGMTWLLSIEGAGKDSATRSLPFQVLAKDGVSVRQGAPGSNMLTRIMLMAATRIEIAIPAPPGGGAFVLRNHVVQTGGNGSGDVWPAVSLARIEWPKQPDHAQDQAGPSPTVQVSPPGVSASAPAASHSGVPDRCVFSPGDRRVIYFVHRFTMPKGDPSAKQEIFGLLAGLRHADGTMDFFDAGDPKATLHSVADVWKAGTTGADHDFPAFGHNPWGTVCTVRGTIEPWELQNWTGEDHDFHVHQSRFTLDQSGRFQFPKVEQTDVAPLRLGDRVLREFAAFSQNTYNDTIPVPRGQSFCAGDPTLPGCTKQGKDDNLECTGEPDAVRCARPGMMSVTMDFTRYEQVGSFVYHCHILEHEDGGMMAAITVLCAPGDQQCAAQQLASAPICKATP